jgi:hypothetical protein
VTFLIKFINDETESQEINWFNYDADEIYDAFNIFTSSLNTFIIFYFVNNKFSHTSIGAHSSMVRIAFVVMIVYYIVFILIFYFPRSMIDFNTKFLLYPFYENDSRYVEGSAMYYISLINIILNIANQLVTLNLYYDVIRNLIFREKVSFYLKNNRYCYFNTDTLFPFQVLLLFVLLFHPLILIHIPYW